MATDNDVRSVWTSADEARLAELLERKQRIMAENEAGVRAQVGMLHFANEEAGWENFSEVSTRWLIENAAQVRAALARFDNPDKE